MISIVQPLHAGNALRLFIEPPASAVRWRVLRKGSDSFSGEDDASALVAYEGDERVIVDATALVNDQMAFYRPFYTSDGVTWIAGPTAYGTPSAIYQEVTTDVLSFLRERLEAGLKVECDRGNIVTELGYVQVYNAAPALTPDLRFPLVTVHLEGEDPSERAIGEVLAPDIFDSIGDEWVESEGWIASVRVTVIGWSLNSDERIELRKCLRRIIIANMPVFASKGWMHVDLSLQDVDAVNGEYQANIYQVMGSFSCLAPVVVSGAAAPISEVVSTVIVD